MTNKDNRNIILTRKYLKDKILRKTCDLKENEKERKQIYELLKRTIDTGESNSALLIGPRGVGKTSLVDDVVEELTQHKNFSSSAVLVRLHGLVHTDDRLALKSATTQMNLDNAVDGKVFGSFAENLAFLLACLRTGQKETAKSVVFVLDEFDLFCAHHNQTLLYNLFDVSQSAQTPICVFGITCRLDVIELLEKRVKSRFSHRQIFLFPGQEENSDVSDLDVRLEKVQDLLEISDKDKTDLPADYRKEWNKQIKDLIQNKKFTHLMQRSLDISTNYQILKNILIKAVSKLSAGKSTLAVSDFQEEVNNLEEDELIAIIQDLSVVELCVLISMKHHVEIYDNQPMNFEMIYTRYTKFTNTNSNIQSLQRPVAMKAFEHLQSLELISSVSGAGGRLQKEYQMFKLLVTSQQIKKAVKKSMGLPTEVVQWASSSLV